MLLLLLRTGVSGVAGALEAALQANEVLLALGAGVPEETKSLHAVSARCRCSAHLSWHKCRTRPCVQVD